MCIRVSIVDDGPMVVIDKFILGHLERGIVVCLQTTGPHGFSQRLEAWVVHFRVRVPDGDTQRNTKILRCSNGGSGDDENWAMYARTGIIPCAC